MTSPAQPALASKSPPGAMPASMGRVELGVLLLSIAIYAAASAQPAVFFVAALVAIVGRAITRSRDGEGLPRGIIGLFILLALLNAIRAALDDGIDVEDFSQFIILVQLAKMFDRHTPRDVGQVLTLSAFLAIGGVLLSPALSVGVLAIAFVPVLALAVIRFQLWSQSWRSKQAWTAAGLLSPASATRYPAGALRRVLGVGLAGTFAVSVVVFLIIPRGLGAQAFGDWTNQPTGSVTGFNDRVQLGGEGLISESQAIVLEMEVSDAQNRQLGAPEQFFYLRGAVLTVYERGQWRPVPEDTGWQSDDNISPSETRGLGRRIGETNLKQTIRLRSIPRRERFYLFGVWEPVAVRLGTMGSLRYETATRVMTGRVNNTSLTYEVWSQLGGGPALGGEPWERTVDEIAGPDVAQLARDILNSAEIEPDPALRDPAVDALAARTIERTLRERYSYTLDQRRGPPDIDPVQWFLFEGRAGHCEYFASSMVAMCRSVGIASRVVTGYIAAEYNADDGTYLVRESNAHAWVEAQVGPGQWRRFDPSPPATIQEIHAAEPTLLGRIARFIDAIEYAWVTSIVGFDENRRLELVGGERDAGQRFGRNFDRDDEGSGVFRRLLGGIVSLVGGVLSIAVAVVVFRSVRKAAGKRRPSRPAWVEDDGPDVAHRRAQAGFYDDLLRELTRLGMPKPGWMPPRRFSGTMADRPGLRDAVRELADLYYTLRFGGRLLEPAEFERARALLADVREQAPADSQTSPAGQPRPGASAEAEKPA